MSKRLIKQVAAVISKVMEVDEVCGSQLAEIVAYASEHPHEVNELMILDIVTVINWARPEVIKAVGTKLYPIEKETER
jgi:hypothetical protein